MVSRRKILNRSRDDLNMDQEEEDIWFSKDKLYKVSGIFLHPVTRELFHLHIVDRLNVKRMFKIPRLLILMGLWNAFLYLWYNH